MLRFNYLKTLPLLSSSFIKRTYKQLPSFSGKSCLTREIVLNKVIDHRIQTDYKGIKRSDVLVTNEAPGGYIVLNRLLYRNAVNINLLYIFSKQLRLLDHAKNVRFIMLRGGTKDFSIGTDYIDIYKWLMCNNTSQVLKFFRKQYPLSRIVDTLRTPLMSFWRGKVIGGGANGISLYSRYRFVSNNVQWKLPECSIGWFPDNGTTYMLSKLPAHIGYYIALTGSTLNMADLLYTEIGTHAVALEDFTTLNQVLTMCEFDDYFEMNIKLHFPQPRLESNLFYERHIINQCFSADTVGEIMTRLKKANTPFTLDCLAKMQKASPLSLAVTHQLLKRAEPLNLEQCLQLEFRVASKFLEHSDFQEGLRAYMVERDNAPKWKYKTTDDIDSFFINKYFEKFPNVSDELVAEIDDYSEIFHEFYDKTENLIKDTNVNIGGIVTVDRDWGRSEEGKSLPFLHKEKYTDKIGW